MSKDRSKKKKTTIKKKTIPRKAYSETSEVYEDESDINDFIYKYTDTDIPIFGSFGFGFENKGFDKIIKLVNEQYDNAIIKLVIPIAHFDPDPDRIHRMRELCFRSNIKPGIILMVSFLLF